MSNYELWSTAATSMLDYYESRSKAIASIRELVELNDDAVLNDLALLCVDDSGSYTEVASGASLLALVYREQPTVTAQ